MIRPISAVFCRRQTEPTPTMGPWSGSPRRSGRARCSAGSPVVSSLEGRECRGARGRGCVAQLAEGRYSSGPECLDGYRLCLLAKGSRGKAACNRRSAACRADRAQRRCQFRLPRLVRSGSRRVRCSHACSAGNAQMRQRWPPARRDGPASTLTNTPTSSSRCGVVPVGSNTHKRPEQVGASIPSLVHPAAVPVRLGAASAPRSGGDAGRPKGHVVGSLGGSRSRLAVKREAYE